MEKRRIRRLKFAELRRAREEQMDTINRAIDNNSEIKKNGIEYIKHFVEEIQSTFTGFDNKMTEEFIISDHEGTTLMLQH
ncbi:334_t:CDS:2 [Entrophospora sp. SA101]|nr:334_t:CDS:2 [Entrophospora sp. SA101]CAJ0843308.1 6315_t:CDS:2 [Entrophospora sp. SA101]CAJ0899377.1 9701_t:CDS:2 [Entrophospora sp. SA101]